MSTFTQLNSVLRELQALVTRAEELIALADGRMNLSGITPDQTKQSGIITAIVARHFGVPERMIYSRDRHASTAIARQVCMVMVRRKMELSSSQIGNLYRRDHGTVLSAFKTVEARLQTECAFGRLMAEIETAIQKELS